MTDEEYTALVDRAQTILKTLEEFPHDELKKEEDRRGIGYEGLGMRMWAAYLEACT